MKKLIIDGTLRGKWVVKIKEGSLMNYLTKKGNLVFRDLQYRKRNSKEIECQSFREACGLAKTYFQIEKNDERYDYGNIKNYKILKAKENTNA